MPSIAAVIFSAFCALVVGGLTALTTNRDGDSQASIDQLNSRIASTESLLLRHTLEIFPVSAPKPEVHQGRSIHHFHLKSGQEVFVVAPSSVKVDELERSVEGLVRAKIVQVIDNDAAWAEAQSWWRGMVWFNGGLAERSTLARFETKPTSVSNIIWDGRRHAVDYRIEEPISFQVRRAGYTIGAAVGTFIGVLLLLALLRWLWSALLARVRELSRAVRGEEP